MLATGYELNPCPPRPLKLRWDPRTEQSEVVISCKSVGTAPQRPLQPTPELWQKKSTQAQSSPEHEESAQTKFLPAALHNPSTRVWHGMHSFFTALRPCEGEYPEHLPNRLVSTSPFGPSHSQVPGALVPAPLLPGTPRRAGLRSAPLGQRLAAALA